MSSSLDVLPDVELGPVRQREHADVLALAVPAVVEVPQLGPLVLRVPLAELVAEASTRAPWPAPSPRRGGRRRTRRRSRARSMASSSVTVCSRLRLARGPGLLDHPARVDRLLHRRRRPGCTPSSATRRSRKSMTSGKLWPVSTCITGNGMRAGPERLLGEAQHHDRVLAAGEQQHRALELGRDLTDDVDRLGLESVQVAPVGRGHRHPRVVDRVVGDGHDGASGGRFRRSGRLGGG